MWEKILALSIEQLTIIGVCIIAINLLLVVLITIMVNKRTKRERATTFVSADRPTRRNAPVRSPVRIGMVGIREEESTGYSYGASWVGADISASAYKGPVPPISIMKAMPDFGEGERIKTVYGEYNPADFVDGNTFGGKYFKAKRPKRIEKRIPLANAYGKKVVLGTIVPKHLN